MVKVAEKAVVEKDQTTLDGKNEMEVEKEPPSTIFRRRTTKVPQMTRHCYESKAFIQKSAHVEEHIFGISLDNLTDISFQLPEDWLTYFKFASSRGTTSQALRNTTFLDSCFYAISYLLVSSLTDQLYKRRDDGDVDLTA